MSQDYKIAFLDIENGPNLGYVWEKYEQNVLSYEREWQLMSFAVKWSHKPKIECYALPDFPLYTTKPFDDSALVKKLWEVFDEADLIIAHNGDRFDCRKANARFAINGLLPPSPYKTIDTLKIARKYFMFNSNKLDDLCQVFNIGRKVKHEGFDMWLGCLHGDPKWWAKMKKYNKHDVLLLEKLYYVLRPWDNNHPNITLSEGVGHLCPACGSKKVVHEGFRYLKAYKAFRYSCADCGKWSTGSREKLTVPVLT